MLYNMNDIVFKLAKMFDGVVVCTINRIIIRIDAGSDVVDVVLVIVAYKIINMMQNHKGMDTILMDALA